MNYKKIGIGLLLIPAGFLLLFTLGEVFSGDVSGLSHLLQLVPVLLLIWLAGKKPVLAGNILIALSLFLGISYALDQQNIITILLVELFLFVPPLVSGVFLVLEEKK